MQRSPDLNERLARIEEKMVTRDDLGELRKLLEKRGPLGLRWIAARSSARRSRWVSRS